MKVKVTETIKEAFEKFANSKSIDKSKIYFMYYVNTYFYNQLGDERICDILTPDDKHDKVMTVTVIDYGNESI